MYVTATSLNDLTHMRFHQMLEDTHGIYCQRDFFMKKNAEFGWIGMEDSEWKKMLIGSDNQRRAPKAKTKGH